MVTGERPSPEEEGGKPAAEEKNPFWKLLTPIAVLALALWVAGRSENFPVLSVLGILGILCLIIAAWAAIDPVRYRSFVEWLLKLLGMAVRKAITGVRTAPQVLGALVKRYRGAIAAGVVLMLAATVGVIWLSATGEAETGCPHAGELRLLTTPADLANYQLLAHRYERFTADKNVDDPHCPTEHLYVYSALPDQARQALAHRWLPEDDFVPDLVVGPQPDAWLPESTLDARVVQQSADDSKLLDPVRAAPA